MDRRFFLTFLICSVLWIFFWEVRWKKGKESQIEEWLQGHRLSQYRHLFQGEWVIEIYLLNICHHCCFQPLVNGLIKSGASHWHSVYFSDLNKDTSEERLFIETLWQGCFFLTIHLCSTVHSFLQEHQG